VLNFLLSALFALVTAAGCGPKYTYPSNQVPESVEKICRGEYGLDVAARVVGRTLGAMFYVDDILDENGQIPRDIHEKMGKIMQAVTRVSLSTDLAVDFCVVVIRDRAPLNELVITRSVDDTKRANSDVIGIEESINRTLFGQGKYQPGAGGEETFVLKEVALEDFLAEQIAQRVRFLFARESKDDEAAAQPFVLVDGSYGHGDGTAKKFRFSVLSLKAEEPRETVLAVLRTASEVLKGYHFTDFTAVEILDYLNRQKLEVTRQVLEAHQAGRMSEQEILDKYLTESQTIQEAFKLFGFNLTDTPDTAENPPIATATP
jgi:hypothetical protein